MSKGNTFETELLEHIFENADIANIGDATGLRGASTAGSLYVALHTGDPGEGGDQTTSEASYTGYARKAIARTAAKWTTASGATENTDEEAFAACTGGSASVTYFSIGVAASGASKILYSGAVSPTLEVSTGITPTIGAGDLDVIAEKL